MPHRYEIFLKKRNYCFINDSKATSFQATKYALRNTKIFLDCWRTPKKNDIFNLSKVSKNIVKCYIIGKNINFFKRQITKQIKKFVVTDNLKNSIIHILKDIKKFKR